MKNNLYLANFNVTFGDKEEPMLNYFDEIVYPALNSRIKLNRGKKTSYFFDNIKIIEYAEGAYVLVGMLIKDTILEIKSKYTQTQGLTHEHEEHPSAPYSIFAIFLKNHRMVLVKNQKGSPDLRSFNSVVRDIFKRFRKEENKKRKKGQKLPYSMVHIVGLPIKGTIEEKLKEVLKIEKLIIRKYPLNGDIDFFPIFEELSDELGSKTSRMVFNSPDNKNKVVEVIDGSSGIVKTELRVRYKNGSRGKLNEDDFTENLEIDLNDDDEFDNKVNNIVGYVTDHKEVSSCSEENNNIYRRNMGKIKGIFNRG
jgi:hypothetical protein